MTEPKQTPIKSPRAEKPKKVLVKKNEAKKKEEPEAKPEAKPEPKPEPKTEIKSEPKAEIKPDLRAEIMETEVVPFKPPRYSE